MMPRCAVRCLALLILIGAPAVRADEPKTKRPLAVDDLYRLERIRASAVSPDGKELVCERQWIDEGGQERHTLRWTDRDRNRFGFNSSDARAPVWSPDGRMVAFLSTRPRPDGWKQTPAAAPEVEPATDIWVFTLGWGTAIPLAGPKKPYGRVFNDGFYGRVAFSPDSTKLVFIADDGKPQRTPEEVAAGVCVVRPDQGEGYTGYGTARVWVASLYDNPKDHAAKRIERLTEDDVWYGDPQWSPNGRQIAVVANKTDDRESVRYSINKNFDIYTIDVQTKGQRQLTDGPGPEVSPRWAPDGKAIGCLSIPRKGSHMDAFNLAVIRLDADLPKEGEFPRMDVVFDHHAGRKDEPHPAPSYPLPDECWYGLERVRITAAVGTATETIRVRLKDGKREPDDIKLIFDRDPEQAKIVDEVGRIKAARARLMPRVNQFLNERQLGESRVVTWDNGDGQTVEGILTVPPEGVATPPYKMVLYPHGGPHGRSALGFDFTVQAFAAAGYAVFQPNYRGSAGYGQKWIDADRGDFGGGDMRDILSGIDYLVKEKLVDPRHQFVYGVSYGGFLTCWLVGHTSQFRAAVAQNAVTDLDAMWGLSDLQSWTEWEFGGKPWEVPDKMRKHSPLTYADKVQTPTLILHSRDDRRCPLPMGRMFYQALRARKVPTELVIYPDEGHAIRQPKHQEDVLRRALAWFEKYDGK